MTPVKARIRFDHVPRRCPVCAELLARRRIVDATGIGPLEVVFEHAHRWLDRPDGKRCWTKARCHIFRLNGRWWRVNPRRDLGFEGQRRHSVWPRRLVARVFALRRQAVAQGHPPARVEAAILELLKG